MKIQDRVYVAIDYTLSLDSGLVVDRSEPGIAFGFVFGSGQVMPGLEKGLEGMEEGYSGKITVEAEEGYGMARPDLYQEIPRGLFPEDVDIQPSMEFEVGGPHGPVKFRVKKVEGDTVLADFNHPLAGERLHFDVQVAEVREPRAEELVTLSEGCGCSTSDCGGCGHGTCGC